MDAIQLIAKKAISTRAIEQNVPSPCVSICRMNEAATLCEGCLRTLDEIRAWSSSSDSEKKAIWARIEQRLSATFT